MAAPNLNSSNFTTEINVINAKDYTVTPYFTANASGVFSNGVQIYANTATNGVTALVGGGQTGATLLTTMINSVNTVASNGDSVMLPPSAPGMILEVDNNAANYTSVFPSTGENIDGLAANASIALAAGQSIFFTCAVAGTWQSTTQPLPGAKFTTGTTTTTFLAAQLNGAAFVNYTNTQATPGSIATRTATQMFTDSGYARVGGSYLLRVTNGQATGTLTITAGTGVTLTGTATIAVNTWRDFVVTYNTATTLTMQNVATGTFS